MKHALQGQTASAPWSPVAVVQRRCACGNHTNGPDARTWDGVQITESVTSRSTTTCPASLTSAPCAGHSTFTIGGQSGGSGVIAVQPAMHNRFYDFHTTRSQSLSFLHDATRNPAGLNACRVVCGQEYSCGGNVIGRHTITRNFRKGTYGGQNVTLIDVTKT
jgi:hypothetical protein